MGRSRGGEPSSPPCVGRRKEAGLTKPRKPAITRTLNAANLSRLGAERLAELLLAVSAEDANWKRRLKLELAAEVGAADLALEIDKRLNVIGASRARVSWRKRPNLIRDLGIHLRAITDRLAPLDGRLAFDRLVAWFDLYPSVSARVKDPKGEVADLFHSAATSDLPRLAAGVEAGHVGAVLGEALQTRSASWASWVGRAAPDLPREIAARLLEPFVSRGGASSPRLIALTRKLADRAGDAEAWILTVPEAERARPEIGADIARRWLDVDRTAEARAALEQARPKPAPPSRWSRSKVEPAEPNAAWDRAEILVLEAEGQEEAAQSARWALFERTLAPDVLDAFVGRLPDFDDVEALDRAHEIAASWFDASKGLAFLMERGALREAAGMAVERQSELNGLVENFPLWAARLEARYPDAALVLVRAQALALARQGLGDSEIVRRLSADAAVLAERASDAVGGHGAFIDALEVAARPTSGKRWR